jgi:hypothetical protein
VLLKNSINRSKNSLLTEADASAAAVSLGSDGHYHHHHQHVVVDEGDEDEEDEEADSFMFPDAGELGDGKGVDSNASEAEWLDSLLETLGDDDDDDFNVDADVHSPHDDEDQMLLSPLISPLVSPTSSSDDLVNQAYDSPPIAVPYPVPYPPFHPPLVHSYQLDPIYTPHDSSSLPYDNPLPYHDIDDVEDLSVPDAIEDTSDDESDATTTPSLIQSSSRSSLVDPNSRVYIEQSYCYPFELDPLPFSGHLDSYNHVYHEC